MLGFSKLGQFPFLDEINLVEKSTNRIYQSIYTDKYEQINDFDYQKNKLRVRIESKSEYPNYFVRDLFSKNSLEQLTFFENPFKSLESVKKELITYKRNDGIELSGILYVPGGYKPNQSEPLPMILWAYPREFKDKSSASQKTNNPNRFVSPNWGSPIYWVNQGYVVLDRAAFPIIGEGDKEPNDSFRTQLIANAEAVV
jgi:dipeptidyl aminopeptidase/acylaminoacyl peptidase